MSKIVPLDPLLLLHIELEQVQPAVWRRVVVPKRITLSKLDRVIQIVMGWSDSHLHEFEIAGKRYGIPDPDDAWNASLLTDKRMSLAKSLGGADSFGYVYDFGDDWQHRIRVEKTLPAVACLQVPFCVDGANACPPEDVGGALGYFEFLMAIKDPGHPEHKTMRDWWGGDFDPRAFDCAPINARLKRIMARR